MITPIRGRKRLISLTRSYILFFRNDNPDKGTETLVTEIVAKSDLSLEMITPIRGRKVY